MNETVHEVIDRLVKECNTQGWDSYGADPVNQESADMAHKIADAIGADWAIPTTEGGIAFEWDVPGGGYFISVEYFSKEK